MANVYPTLISAGVIPSLFLPRGIERVVIVFPSTLWITYFFRVHIRVGLSRVLAPPSR